MKVEKIKSINPLENEFTSVLGNIHRPPKKLFLAGSLPENRPPCVAIVGTRKPSDYGKYVTHKFAYDLAKAGVYVISGLAFGVDIIAHKAALEAGGQTVAVLPTSLHKIYPANHEVIATNIIVNGGALLSEHPANTTAMKHHFLERNKLISGLADAVLVTEATERSGTFSTVGHAVEQNREVFAVPGPINSLCSVGPNQLLRQGARIATSTEDILHVIAPQLLRAKKAPVAMTTDEALIVQLLDRGISDGEDLLARSGLSASDYLQALTMLEISGVVRPTGGNCWTLLK